MAAVELDRHHLDILDTIVTQHIASLERSLKRVLSNAERAARLEAIEESKWIRIRTNIAIGNEIAALYEAELRADESEED